MQTFCIVTKVSIFTLKNFCVPIVVSLFAQPATLWNDLSLYFCLEELTMKVVLVSGKLFSLYKHVVDDVYLSPGLCRRSSGHRWGT